MRCGWLAVAALSGTVLIVGCAAHQADYGRRPTSQPAPAPLARVDEAVLPEENQSATGIEVSGADVRRRWATATGWRRDGAVPAGPTYFGSADKPTTRPDWQSAFIDCGGFLWNTVKLPVEMVLTRPDKPVVYDASEE